MVFSSLVFLLFLALHLVVYWAVPERFKNPVLLVSSLIFYAWGGPRYLVLLLGEAAISWFCALRIERAGTQGQRKLFLILECVALLGLLAIFKYLTFILGNVQALAGVPEEIPNIVLPIGISFYTFQLISYVADVYMEDVEAQPNYFKLLLYASLFHQCIAGPIVRYKTVAADIDRRKVSKSDLYAGMRRFCIGLAKKAILANSAASVADMLLPIGTPELLTQAGSAYWLGMLFYMFQIYLDFSAYSDMAIGMGRMVGFHYLENFDHPYMAKSIQDFWRRWHISLSSFFRDYIYIPLGGSRCSKVKYIRNMTVVWFLTGMWHGASWNYILWGLYFLVFLLLEKFVIRDRLPKIASHIYALVVIYFGWVLFKFENFDELGGVIAGMFGANGMPFVDLTVSTALAGNIFLIVVCVIACTSLGKNLRQLMFARSRDSKLMLTVFRVTEAVLPAVLLVLAIIALAGASYNPFIYFQF